MDEDPATVRGTDATAARRRHDAALHERLTIAMEHGCHIEAIKLLEKMLADRLHTHLHWRVVEAQILDPAGIPESLRRRLTFDRSVTVSTAVQIIALDFNSLSMTRFEALPTRILSWARKSRRAVRSTGFTVPTQTTFAQDDEEYFARLATFSTAGRQLLLQVMDWDRASRRHHQMAARP